MDLPLLNFLLAVLAAGAPETYAFMADEALASVPGSKMEYTLKQYLQFRQALIDKAKSLNKIGKCNVCVVY